MRATTARREVVVYVPAGDDPATAGIAPGSAIVGVPEPGSEEVCIHFEGAVHGQTGMRTLADRALHARGRLRERYPTVAARTVTRAALVAVGTFAEAAGRIVLAGGRSEAAVAAWLGVGFLDPAELRCSAPARIDAVALAPDIRVSVNGALAAALISRAGLWREEGGWAAPDGRRTSADAEALTWALVALGRR